MSYAENTSVSIEASIGEIQRTIRKYGATGFMQGWHGTKAHVAFELSDRAVRFELNLPDQKAKEFTHTPNSGKVRTREAALKEWEQACRQRFRALALCIKAKLEAVEAGIATFEEEFLAHIVVKGGKTVGQVLIPQLNEVRGDVRLLDYMR